MKEEIVVEKKRKKKMTQREPRGFKTYVE